MNIAHATVPGTSGPAAAPAPGGPGGGSPPKSSAVLFGVRPGRSPCASPQKPLPAPFAGLGGVGRSEGGPPAERPDKKRSPAPLRAA